MVISHAMYSDQCRIQDVDRIYLRVRYRAVFLLCRHVPSAIIVLPTWLSNNVPHVENNLIHKSPKKALQIVHIR